MPFKYALCTVALSVPLLIAGAAPSSADVDVGFGVGVGSPYYYGSPYYGNSYYGHRGFYGPAWGPGYGLRAYDDEVYLGAQIDDDAVETIEPAAADPAPCVKTNVRNLRNACPY